jgi:hypothetical protein
MNILIGSGITTVSLFVQNVMLQVFRLEEYAKTLEKGTLVVLFVKRNKKSHVKSE